MSHPHAPVGSTNVTEASSLERLWYPREPESLVQRLARSPLQLAALGFRAGVAARNALYDSGVFPAHRIREARVISVGNITVGGAGKTPVTIFLARRLLDRGEKVAVLTRGHGRASKASLSFDSTNLPTVDEAGDEPILIAQRCPGVRLYVGADRVERAHAAKKDGATVLLLDDGMQHRRLARDVEIAVVDEFGGLGNGRMLPRGPLREPPSALRRASLLWLRLSDFPGALSTAPIRTRPGAVTDDGKLRIWRLPRPDWVRGLVDDSVPFVRAAHVASAVLGPGGEEQPVTTLAGTRVHALCGLARPGAFLRTLHSLGATVTGTMLRPDHHRWTEAEVERARTQAASAGALLVTTEKDAVKFQSGHGAHVVRIGVQLIYEAEAEALLDRVLAVAPNP